MPERHVTSMNAACACPARRHSSARQGGAMQGCGSLTSHRLGEGFEATRGGGHAELGENFVSRAHCARAASE